MKFQFKEASLYLSGGFGIERVDCKTIAVETDVRFAQYSNAIKLTFLPKGKRKPRQAVLSYSPFAVILPAKDAIDPDEPLAPMGDGGSQSRYSSFDPRWRSDLMVKVPRDKALLIVAGDASKIVIAPGYAESNEPSPGFLATRACEDGGQ